MFPKDGEPCIVSEDIALFRYVLATFYQYEKYIQVYKCGPTVYCEPVLTCVSCSPQTKPESSHSDVSEVLKKFLKHLPQVFARDFPFYLLLFYRMHT